MFTTRACDDLDGSVPRSSGALNVALDCNSRILDLFPKLQRFYSTICQIQKLQTYFAQPMPLYFEVGTESFKSRMGFGGFGWVWYLHHHTILSIDRPPPLQ